MTVGTVEEILIEDAAGKPWQYLAEWQDDRVSLAKISTGERYTVVFVANRYRCNCHAFTFSVPHTCKHCEAIQQIREREAKPMSENKPNGTLAPTLGGIERALIQGDLSKLTEEDRMKYYRSVCESVGLNPLTQPFAYITLSGKLTLYARKDATDQLRNVHGISIQIMARELTEECYVVTARATNPAGRTDESIGAVTIANLKGDARANALMKCETKAKRRVTLSICGLGILDESEIETIPKTKAQVPVTTEPYTFKLKSKSLSTDPGPEVIAPSGVSTSTAEDSEVSAADPVEEASQGEATAQSGSAVEEQPRLPLQLEFIDANKGVNFHRHGRDALEQKYKKDAKRIVEAWLKEHDLVDGEGRGSTTAIRTASFYSLRDLLEDDLSKYSE